ncbi:MAG: acylneuraminate cytidylyltransferase family protein [Bacteroidetes bacterium]|nr:acylneuraminate cytidylyltransferase family protein [Bacteroidota bacterium]
MNILAIIPARGGSKGIKRKNLVQINGKSLVGLSIQHALQSKLITRTIISSDDEEIIAEAVRYGAEAPFVRPKELAEDHVLDIPVFEHALKFLEEKEKYIPDYVVHLRPTAPYRKPEWIDEAIQLLMDHPEADSVRSVSEPDKHPYRIFRIDEKGFLDPIMKHEHPVPYLLRRQDLPKMYYYNCVIDVTKPSTIFDKHSMTGDKILPYIMNPDDVIDIDSPRDLKVAEVLFGGKI